MDPLDTAGGLGTHATSLPTSHGYAQEFIVVRSGDLCIDVELVDIDLSRLSRFRHDSSKAADISS